MWARVADQLAARFTVVAVDLLTNPLVHVFAVTLLSKAAA